MPQLHFYSLTFIPTTFALVPTEAIAGFAAVSASPCPDLANAYDALAEVSQTYYGVHVDPLSVHIVYRTLTYDGSASGFDAGDTDADYDGEDGWTDMDYQDVDAEWPWLGWRETWEEISDDPRSEWVWVLNVSSDEDDDGGEAAVDDAGRDELEKAGIVSPWSFF